jgi:hypothetical protein
MSSQDFEKASRRCVRFGAYTCLAALALAMMDSFFGEGTADVKVTGCVLSLLGLGACALGCIFDVKRREMEDNNLFD